MARNRKKNKGNEYAERGEQFAENVIKETNDSPHPAQNAPATPHNR
ncbi:hypothetical protein [Cohnella thailandensis]|jgi:hypothetical protein|uniref:Uncharacterized protein n=1 Tax=Cohnella thailandensis TaxID=557557 RepID=A0A841SUI1_9BACL|nr:hypothetical protein [Cohnella thailandensis]MBB6633868.1 hypothetical protein [Cohnella thailandensis]MBP1972551.1 hypothetical protein [Cohnella thailandensis]